MIALTGTTALARLVLRRDRLLLALWVFWLTVVPVNFAASIGQLYPTVEDRQRMAAASNANNALITLFGPVHETSIGALTAWRVSIITVFVALVCALTVIRHTRAEEQAGRGELIGAAAVGRHAGLAAVLLVTGAATVLHGALVASALIALGLPAVGATTLGMQFVVAGWVFAAMAAVVAQLTASAGTARGIMVTVLGGTVLLRAVGDIGDRSDTGTGWLGWPSPLGWILRLRPFADEQWWWLTPPIAVAAGLVMLSFVLAARRDLGSGLLHARPGPASATARLRGPVGLAWRMHRPLVLGWLAGLAVLGSMLGAMTGSVGDLVGDSPYLSDSIARLGGPGVLVDAYLAAALGLCGLAAGGYAVQACLRMRAEETAGRAEPLLATTVGRLQWAGSHLLFAIGGPIAALLVAGITAGLTSGRTTTTVAGALLQAPAVGVLAGIAMALTGLRPRLAPLGWAAVAVTVLISLFGTALGADEWLTGLSPYAHVPKVPGDDVSALPVVWLAVTATALTVAGLAGLRRRDMPVP